MALEAVTEAEPEIAEADEPAEPEGAEGDTALLAGIAGALAPEAEAQPEAETAIG